MPFVEKLFLPGRLNVNQGGDHHVIAQLHEWMRLKKITRNFSRFFVAKSEQPLVELVRGSHSEP